MPKIAVSVRASDVDGMLSESSKATLFEVDSQPPETILIKPQRNSSSPSQVRIHGGATDDRQVVSVQIVLRDLESGQYWDGSIWCVERQTIDVRTSIEGNWHYFLQLPPGHYGVWVRSFDVAGNFDPSPASTVFTVQ